MRGEALIYGHPAGCRFISTAHIMVKPHHQHHLRQPSLPTSKWLLSSRDLIITTISIIVIVVLGSLIVNICYPLSWLFCFWIILTFSSSWLSSWRFLKFNSPHCPGDHCYLCFWIDSYMLHTKASVDRLFKSFKTKQKPEQVGVEQTTWKDGNPS